MKFISNNNQIGEFEMPNGLESWIQSYDANIDPEFYIDLREEMPKDQYGYLTCIINRKLNLMVLNCFESQYVNCEGNRGFYIRNKNNLFESNEEIGFKPIPNQKGLFYFPKYALLELADGIEIIKYLIENHSYPENVQFDRLYF